MFMLMRALRLATRPYLLSPLITHWCKGSGSTITLVKYKFSTNSIIFVHMATHHLTLVLSCSPSLNSSPILLYCSNHFLQTTSHPPLLLYYTPFFSFFIFALSDRLTSGVETQQLMTLQQWKNT